MGLSAVWSFEEEEEEESPGEARLERHDWNMEAAMVLSFRWAHWSPLIVAAVVAASAAAAAVAAAVTAAAAAELNLAFDD